jgi:hypothetical protein
MDVNRVHLGTSRDLETNSVQNDQGSAKGTLPFTSLASSNGAMTQKRKYSGQVEIPWKKRH